MGPVQAWSLDRSKAIYCVVGSVVGKKIKRRSGTVHCRKSKKVENMTQEKKTKKE